MAFQRTFAIIKPHAVSEGFSGDIIKIIELNKFTILRMNKKQLDKKTAQAFYAIHKEKSFFGELVDNISSGPAVVIALEAENAIQEWRNLMGPTNPVGAPAGTLRRMFGKNISFNAVHGSDAPETAETELKLFFPEL